MKRSQIQKLLKTNGYRWLMLAAISDSASEVTGYAAQPHALASCVFAHVSSDNTVHSGRLDALSTYKILVCRNRWCGNNDRWCCDVFASEEAQRRRGKQYVLGNLYSHDDSVFCDFIRFEGKNVQGLQQSIRFVELVNEN